MTRLILLALALPLIGCKPTCDPTTGCPTPVSVRGECTAERTCETDGVIGWCQTGECVLARGQTLTVPVDTLDLKKTPDLFVDYRTHAAGAPDPTKIDAELDGVKGRATAASPDGKTPTALVTWDPFPSNPKALTIRFDDGTVKTVDANFEFEDGGCEMQNQSCSAF
jgi:hypothetical protein